MRIKRINKNTNRDDKVDIGVDLSLINDILIKYSAKRGSLISILQAVQDVYGYIPDSAFKKIANETSYELTDLYGVATFYTQFRLKPVGKHIIKVCHGTACHVQSATEITQALSDFLKIKDTETTADGLFTLESVACLGCCSLAPVMMVDDDTFGNLTPNSVVKIIRGVAAESK